MGANLVQTYDFQEFFDRYPQDNGSIFLLNGYTGEAIYDVDRWGSPLPGARKFSHWFEPTIQVQLDSREDGNSRRRVNMSNVRVTVSQTLQGGDVEDSMLQWCLLLFSLKFTIQLR